MILVKSTSAVQVLHVKVEVFTAVAVGCDIVLCGRQILTLRLVRSSETTISTKTYGVTFLKTVIIIALGPTYFNLRPQLSF
jgi:hypothetical protein